MAHNDTAHTPDRDADILQMLLAREEKGLSLVMERYGRLLKDLAMRICGSPFDAEECVNDALLDLWQTVPPHTPPVLLSYVSVLVRRRAIDRVRYYAAERRAGSAYFSTLEELEACIPDGGGDRLLDDLLIRECMSDFLGQLGKSDRAVFTLRYFRFLDNGEIARALGVREAAVASRLYRLRKKLKETLSRRGIDV